MSWNDCPTCGGRITFWQRQQQRSGRLEPDTQGFVCPHCGTTLAWSVGRWRWVSVAVMIAGMLGLAYPFLAKVPPGQSWNWSLWICGSIAVINLVLWLAFGRMVVSDDADAES
jgi:DNA-directed RNA polymerase subunit RPC12/RpoP